MKSQPLVTSISSKLKKTYDVDDTKIKTPEEIKVMKNKMLGIVDEGLGQFYQNLLEKKVELNSTLDLERLVKLMLVLTGEPDSINKTSGQVEEETNISTQGELPINRVLEVLDVQDESVKAIYDKLYSSYNLENDK